MGSRELLEEQQARNSARFGRPDYPGGERGEWPSFPKDATPSVVTPHQVSDEPGQTESNANRVTHLATQIEPTDEFPEFT